MAVLGIFCEDIDFPNGTAPSVSTAGNVFRSGFARCAVTPSTVNGEMQSTTFTSILSAWLSARIYLAGTFQNLGVSNGIGFESLGASGGIYVGFYGNGQVKITKGVLGATVLASSSVGLFSQSLFKVDMQVINYGGSGTVNVYINGSLAVSYTGDITTSGVTSLNCVAVGNNNNWGEQTYVSECVIADESTLGWQGVDLREITANGTTQQWSNPDISNFDPITINDANSTYSNTAGQDEQAALANSVTGNFAIKAVKIVARANAPAGSAVTNLKLGFRNGSGTVGVGAAHALTTAFAPVSDLLTTDPTTGQPFTSIDGYQLDLRSA